MGKEIDLYRLDALDGYTIIDIGVSIQAGQMTEVGDVINGSVNLTNEATAHPDRSYFGVVKGYSMVEAGIMPGFNVVIDTSVQPKNGDIVVAAVKDAQTIKYYKYDEEQGLVFLIPANKNMKPIIIGPDDEGFRIIGVVTTWGCFNARSDVQMMTRFEQDSMRLMMMEEDIKDSGASDFNDYLLVKEGKEVLMNRLHHAIRGKKGKGVALVITCAVEEGYMLRPDYAAVKREFGEIGIKQGYNKYMNSDSFNPMEKIAMKEYLKGVREMGS